MAEYEDREQQFDASLGDVMGSWMLEVAKADLTRQQGWLAAVEALSTPDKSGKVPTVTLSAGLKDADGKLDDSGNVTFPTVLALLGQQFAAEEADLAMTMNVSASQLSEVKGQQQGSAEGSASFGIGALKATVKVTASFSESEDRKRQSDYRATTTASVKMARVPTPEPIQRVLAAYLRIVDTECQLALAAVEANARAKAQAAGLLPKDDGGGKS